MKVDLPFGSILRDLIQQHLLSLQLRHRAFVRLPYRQPNARKLYLFETLFLHPLFRLMLSPNDSVRLPMISQLVPVFWVPRKASKQLLSLELGD